MEATQPVVVLHEDEHLLVVNKPAGVTVHAGAGVTGPTLVDQLHQQFGLGFDSERAGLVHRLDKETSGVLLIAKDAKTKAALQALFKTHQVEKHYQAIVKGAPRPPVGRIDAPVGRHATARTKMSVNPGGRNAVTEYRTVASVGGFSLLDVSIATGRTHQIRVHLAALGTPVVGDVTYGFGSMTDRPLLHAAEISLTHPVTGRALTVTAPLPDDVRLFGKEHGLL